MDQLREFETSLEELSRGDMTLVSDLNAMQLAIQGAIRDAAARGPLREKTRSLSGAAAGERSRVAARPRPPRGSRASSTFLRRSVPAQARRSRRPRS